MTVDKLTLWDDSSEPSEDHGLVYRWSSYAEHGSVRSVLRHVETHGERLRRKYLAWIHALGESQIDGQRVIDHLAFEDGLSYWWLTPFVEKSPWRSPSIVDSIRLLALEEIIIQNQPRQVVLVSEKKFLYEIVAELCKNLNLEFQRRWPRIPNPTATSARSLYHALPQPLQAFITLIRQLWYRWPLRNGKDAPWFSGGGAAFFCSYFLNVDPSAANQGSFQSHYWGGIHELMNRLGVKSNWAQIFIAEGTAPSAGKAKTWIQKFNAHRHEQGFHKFVDSYLSLRIVGRVVKRWLRLLRISLRLKDINQAFRPPGSQISLWPLLRGEWNACMRGGTAIAELFWLELFAALLDDLPLQQKGFYLCENQPWERALIHSWRKHGNGQLTAVPHATVRFWHLGYFSDQRTLRSTGAHPIPQPDFTALNGRAAVDAYVAMDYPKDQIVECEALRFQHLNDDREDRIEPNPTREKTNGTAVLILGDYTQECTTRILELLDAAIPKMSGSFTYTVKPHPNSPVNASDYPSLHLRVTHEPLDKILRGFDIAFCSNRTSAALDAYLMGVPVVVMLDEKDLNFSPLRGYADARFVGTPEELAEAFQTADQRATGIQAATDFFFLDPDLPRWRNLLLTANIA